MLRVTHLAVSRLTPRMLYGLRQFAYLDLVFNTFLIDNFFYPLIMTRFSQDAPAAENAVEKEIERNRGVCLATR